jgi:serine/threonine protein kinase
MPINNLNDKTIFTAVRVIDSPEGQQAYMQQACGDDVDQRNRVAALLHKFQPDNQFLESPASELHLFLDAPRVLETPTQIGPYRICEQIGEGGMGVVYLAQQRKPMRRKVALKVIKPGMDSQQVIARFEAERQALAVMNHPGIARIFDAGMTEEGRPFFVMELIRGVRIDKYCDDAKLTVKDRLNLFIDVCQAIQHAHQKGVIHRDLKPSNILVTLHDGIPVVKVIDFGIAKALNHDLTERTLFTHSSEMIGTPAYMSPEQLEMSGLDVGTRSDVYSLGVLLYKLRRVSLPLTEKRSTAPVPTNYGAPFARTSRPVPVAASAR